MKKSNALKSLLLSMFLALPLVSCDTPNSASQQESESHSASQEESTPSNESTPSEESSTPEEKVEIITIAEAIEIAKAAGENATAEAYVIKGTIKTVSNAQYGEMTVEDSTGSLYIYGVDGYSTLDDKPVAGDLITLSGKLKTYKGTPEMDRGYIVEFEHVSADEQIDLTQYTKATVLEARNATDDSKLKVSGTVAAITYANGLKPNGFYLVDNTSSIYVYSGDIASQVVEGNTIEIAGIKDYYILDTEKTNAAKFGYKGCCQLTNPVLINNDKGNTEWNKSWVSETTVKDLIETDFSENITTEIYKVNAYVKKVPGSGFTNYYINDIDGLTGSYVYTQANGNDFGWLDTFDGKICTVYVTAHNAKATSAGCVFRLIPVAVSYDNYQFDLSKSCEYALRYHVNDQFKDSYSGDPALQVVTSISNNDLGIENVSISYQSSNSDALYFANENGQTVMHINNTASSKVVVTITATYNGITATSKIEIDVIQAATAEGVTVKQAIDTADNEIVQVKGIVAASLVNQTGFYLIDDTGLIAVRTTAEQIANIELGNEVVVKGTRKHLKSKDGSHIGQSVIDSAEVVANYYGSYEYSSSTFNNSFTIDQLYNFDEAIDYSTQGYIVKGTVLVEETKFYTNIYIKDLSGSKNLRLYSSSASQYNWLKEYADKEVTFHLALCNWNDKDYYTGCVLAVVTSEGTVVNNYNFK